LIVEYFAAIFFNALVLSSFASFGINLRHSEVGTEIAAPLTSPILFIVILTVQI
jgi:hypothetical protein